MRLYNTGEATTYLALGVRCMRLLRSPSDQHPSVLSPTFLVTVYSTSFAAASAFLFSSSYLLFTFLFYLSFSLSLSPFYLQLNLFFFPFFFSSSDSFCLSTKPFCFSPGRIFSSGAVQRKEIYKLFFYYFLSRKKERRKKNRRTTPNLMNHPALSSKCCWWALVVVAKDKFYTPPSCLLDEPIDNIIDCVLCVLCVLPDSNIYLFCRRPCPASGAKKSVTKICRCSRFPRAC